MKGVDNFAILRVPIVNHPVKPSTEKLVSIVCETNIFDSFGMPHICSQTLLVRHHIPYLTSSVMAC